MKANCRTADIPKNRYMPELGNEDTADAAESNGRTYCVMALPRADALPPEPVKRREKPRWPENIDGEAAVSYRTKPRRARLLLRIAVGLLLTAAMMTMPLWLTSDTLLPVMKRLSAAAIQVELPEESYSLPVISGGDTVTSTEPVTTTTTAPTTTTAVATSALATEGMLPVLEQRAEGGTKVGDIHVKNSTGYSPDFAALLKQRADCRIKLNAGYQVLIVHTHTTEGYAQRNDGFYDPNYSPRTTDADKNVVAVGEVLKNKLEEAGIRTLHATELHDHPQYNGSYDRALDTIEKYLEEHPSIEMVLDVHRDAITYDDGTKLKPTAQINGHKAAQIMIISGCDAGGRLYFPEWQSNLTMALQLQQSAQELYPGLMRPLSFAPYRYNMHMTPNSLLLEFGTDANTLEEALCSAELMGDALVKVLLDYNVDA